VVEVDPITGTQGKLAQGVQAVVAREATYTARMEAKIPAVVVAVVRMTLLRPQTFRPEVKVDQEL
jgi:hypothetical protein